MWSLTVLSRSGQIGEVEGLDNQSDLHERAVLVDQDGDPLVGRVPVPTIPLLDGDYPS